MVPHPPASKSSIAELVERPPNNPRSEHQQEFRRGPPPDATAIVSWRIATAIRSRSALLRLMGAV
jgi:hypothetical protein